MRPIATDGAASSVGLSWSWALQKQLNRPRCRLGCALDWAQITMYYMGYRSPREGAPWLLFLRYTNTLTYLLTYLLTFERWCRNIPAWRRRAPFSVAVTLKIPRMLSTI